MKHLKEVAGSFAAKISESPSHGLTTKVAQDIKAGKASTILLRLWVVLVAHRWRQPWATDHPTSCQRPLQYRQGASGAEALRTWLESNAATGAHRRQARCKRLIADTEYRTEARSDANCRSRGTESNRVADNRDHLRQQENCPDNCRG